MVNFDIPDEAENYMHRIGRTGRADLEGRAISFITKKDEEYITAIEYLMQRSIPMAAMPEEVEQIAELLNWEKPKVKMKMYLTALPSTEGKGAAFHQKSDKNRKVNKHVSHKDKMVAKYGKPKKRKKK